MMFLGGDGGTILKGPASTARYKSKYLFRNAILLGGSGQAKINLADGLVFRKKTTMCDTQIILIGEIAMNTSHTANIANSFKKWSIAHSKRSNDNDQPGLSTPIALAQPALQHRPERSVQAEHRGSFS